MVQHRFKGLFHAQEVRNFKANPHFPLVLSVIQLLFESAIIVLEGNIYVTSSTLMMVVKSETGQGYPINISATVG